MFAGRVTELAALNGLLDAPKSALILITGRPRIGKSRLIFEACHNRNVIYLHASQETARLNFQAFRRACVDELGAQAGLDTHNDWPGLLSAIAVAAVDRPGLVIVFDNFSSLYDADEALAVTIRTFWQSGLPEKSGLKLILSGGNIAKMTELARGNPAVIHQSLSACAPVFFDLMPLPLHEAVDFLPNYSAEAQVAAYAIFGGIPSYLRLCSPDKPLAANISDLLLAPDARLVDEPEQLLTRDLRDLKVYSSILRAISIGYMESGEIRSFIMGGHSGMSISPYLEKLRSLRLISDVRSLDADPKARYIRFSILDPLTRFWHLFIQPNRLKIEQGKGRDIFDTTIKSQISDYMVLGFEDICRDFMRLHAAQVFDCEAEMIGQVWGAGYNIAIAGRLSNGTPVFGACAWGTRPIGEAGIEHLMQQVRLSDAAPDSPIAARSKAPLPIYTLFSRSGFTPELIERQKQSSTIRLLTPADIAKRTS